jgi:RimJ/RimL family protein N-acetyltransferase
MPDVSAAAVPTLETERLVLRGHSLGDYPDCVALWGDTRVTRYIGGMPLSREDVWSRLLRYIGHWAALGFGYWVAREKASGRFVGEVGFADYRRVIEPAFDGVPEIGWVLAPTHWGMGFATEAVAAACAWGDGHFAAPGTVCIVDPQNAASLQVAAKSGYAEFGRAEYKGQERILLQRPAPVSPANHHSSGRMS